MKRYIPLMVLLLLMAAAYYFELHTYLSFDRLKEHRQVLKDLVRSHPYQAPLVFMTAYIISTALSIPGGIYLSIFGGFLFPQPYSTLYVVVAATIGASLIFLAAKTALRDVLKERAGTLINRMKEGFQEDAANYLLFLRLVPLFPFWAVNIAPAFFNVGLFTFIWTTFVGIIPGAFVFTQAGVGLGAILDTGETLSIDAIFNIQIRIALIALGLFALLPVVIKKLKKKKM